MLHQQEATAHSLVCHSVLDGPALAAIVAANYDLPAPIECALYQRGLNDVYLITAAGDRYILRISHSHRFGAFDEQAYRFELDLLTFLANKTLPVTHPIPCRDGDTLGAILAPEGTRFYTLFTYAPGEIPATITPEQGHILGATLARIHLAADNFTTCHPRFHLDERLLLDESLRHLRAFPGIHPADLSYIETLSASLRDHILTLPKHPGAYGIVHGDFWWANLHFAGHQATIFDFDFCGYGWRIMDIAALRANALVHNFPLCDDVIAAVITGYQSIRPLSESELQSLPTFEKIILIWYFGVWTTLTPLLGTRWFHPHLTESLTCLRDWIAHEQTNL